LIIVVIRNEVFDRVLGKKRAELLVKLRGECLIVRDDERGPLRLVDHTRDRECLAAAGDAEQNLVFGAVAHAARERFNCLRLVATGTIVGFKNERHNPQ
jgi:hypothetical protein